MGFRATNEASADYVAAVSETGRDLFFFLGFLLRALKSFSDIHEQALDVRVFWKDLRDHRHELQSVHFNQNEIFQFYKEIFGFDSVCRQERLTYAQLSYSSTVA